MRADAATSGAAPDLCVPERLPGSSWFAWTTCVLFVLIGATWVLEAGHTVTGLVAAFGIPAVFLAFTAVSVAMPRTELTTRIGGTANALAVLTLIGSVTSVVTYALLDVTPAPLADGALLRADQLMGFDWGAWTAAIAAHAWLHAVLQRVYGLLMFESLLCVVALGLSGMRAEADRLIAAVALGVWVTLILFALFPAVGHFAISGEARQFNAIRSGTLHAVSLERPKGIVSFPSFHTTLALLLPWSMRRTWLAWPAYLFSILMLVSIPSQGGHYLIDMIAGAAVAAVAARGAGWLTAPRSVT